MSIQQGSNTIKNNEENNLSKTTSKFFNLFLPKKLYLQKSSFASLSWQIEEQLKAE